MLQLCCSVEESLQAVPPFSLWVSTFLVRTCTPPPQVLLHVAHESHVPHTQFTRQNDKYLCIAKIFFVNKVKNHSLISSIHIDFWFGINCTMLIITSRASSGVTVLLFRGQSWACCSTIFLVGIHFSCPNLQSSTTCFTAGCPCIPWSPRAIY